MVGVVFLALCLFIVLLVIGISISSRLGHLEEKLNLLVSKFERREDRAELPGKGGEAETAEGVTAVVSEVKKQVSEQGISRPVESREVGEYLQAAAQKVRLKEYDFVEQDKAKPIDSVEQIIGTKWVNIAGIITLIVGICFFLKFVYDYSLIGEVGRIIITVAGGVAALAIGEVTRRRDYGIAAKGLTALGFALLYAAVFCAYGFYELIGSVTAFGFSIIITGGALAYAVALDEIVIAFLALLGGFLTPVILSVNENRPFALFIYVSILSIGVLGCSVLRKWRAVNILAFAGTFILYTGWFEKFYVADRPEQMGVAIGWLGVFFTMFLVLPNLYELVKRIVAKKEAPVLAMGNAVIVLYFLYRILYGRHSNLLCFCIATMAIMHFVMAGLVRYRCREDERLRLVLAAIGIFCVTIAIPLYFEMYGLVMAWAAEAVILALIGTRYRSLLTQLGSFIVLVLSLFDLLIQLPMYSEPFRVFFNEAFLSWFFVAAGLYLFHLIYRQSEVLDPRGRGMLAQILYCGFVFVLLAASIMHLHYHLVLNLSQKYSVVYRQYFCEGLTGLLSLSVLSFVVQPFSPKGRLCRVSACFFTAVGSVFIITFFFNFHREQFVVFFNKDMLIGLLFVAALFVSSALLRRRPGPVVASQYVSGGVAFAGIFVFWVLLSEEIYLYWYYRGLGAEGVINWKFLAQMYLSVMWAIYGSLLVAVGLWRKKAALRYAALGLFGIVLAKAFIFDMSMLKSVYRIAGFIVLGLAMIAVSFLYQYCKKQGFFEKVALRLSSQKDEKKE
ncbi:MAG: DUF2339 domain-containing protein [Planctomycetota bacterium]